MSLENRAKEFIKTHGIAPLTPIEVKDDERARILMTAFASQEIAAVKQASVVAPATAYQCGYDAAIAAERERIADELRSQKAAAIKRESVLEAEADEGSTRQDVIDAFEVGIERGYDAAIRIIEPDEPTITELRSGKEQA